MGRAPLRPHALDAFLAALSFLTRLTPGRPCSLPVLQAAVAWYPAVGLVLGLLCTLPVWIAASLHGSPWLSAWIYVALGFWCTRGMHWDGLADLGDAWGSGAAGECFWDILRDSRLGAYGAMSLALCFSLHLLLAQQCAAQGALAPLILAPLAGRCVAVILSALTPPHDPASLGGLACAGATRGRAALAAATGFAAALFLLSLPAVPVLCGGAALLIRRLRALALARGGCNGDFLGAGILLGEALTLLAGLIR